MRHTPNSLLHAPEGNSLGTRAYPRLRPSDPGDLTSTVRSMRLRPTDRPTEVIESAGWIAYNGGAYDGRVLRLEAGLVGGCLPSGSKIYAGG